MQLTEKVPQQKIYNEIKTPIFYNKHINFKSIEQFTFL